MGKKAAAKPAGKAAARSAARTPAKPAPRPERKPAHKPAARTATKPAAKPVTKPAAKPAARARAPTVVLFYSRFGATAAVAAEIARELGGELREIRARRRHSWPAMGFGALFNIRFPIEPMELNLTGAGFVVLCSPIWAGKPACPVMTFLDSARLTGVRTGVVLTVWPGETERTVEATRALLEARGAQVVSSARIDVRRATEQQIRAKAREVAEGLKKV